MLPSPTSRQAMRRRQQRFHRHQIKLSKNLINHLSGRPGCTIVGEDPLFSFLAKKFFPYSDILAVCQIIVDGSITTVAAVPLRYWNMPGAMAMLQAVKLEMARLGRNCELVSQALIASGPEEYPCEGPYEPVEPKSTKLKGHEDAACRSIYRIGLGAAS
jgi:hypothetical protein